MRLLLALMYVLAAGFAAPAERDKTLVVSPDGRPDGPDAMAFVNQAPAPTNSDEAAVLQAEQALNEAATRADKEAVAALLDDAFTATSPKGRTLTKAQAIRSLSPPSPSASDVDVKARAYGDLAIVTGIRRANPQAAGVRYARVWVKRPAGWRAIVHQGNAIAAPSPSAPGMSAAALAAAGCENPCKTLPYTPTSAAEREILASYQMLETAVATHDAEEWARHFADEFVVIGRDGHPTTKPERIAAIREQKKTGTPVNPGPLKSMQIWVVGDAAVMTSDHATAAAKPTPYRVTRVWVKRDGRWQMAYSQQTTVEQPGAAQE